MASAIDPTLGGALNVFGAGVPRDELKSVLTIAASEITALQAFDETATDVSELDARLTAVEDTLQESNIVPGQAVDLSTVSSPIAVAAGATVTASGNANGDKVFSVADGTFEGQSTSFFFPGSPNGNTIDIVNSAAAEIVEDVLEGSSHEVVWTNSAWVLADSGTGTPLSDLAFLNTVTGDQVLLDDAGSAYTYDNLNELATEFETAISAVSAGISSVSGAVVPVDDGTTITAALHASLWPNSTALEPRIIRLRESVSQTTMTVTLGNDLPAGLSWVFITAEDQTGAVTIEVEDAGGSPTHTINGVETVAITGGNKAVTVLSTSATTFAAIGAIDGARDLDGNLSADDFTISRAVLKDTAEAVNALGNQSGGVTADYEDGQNVTLTLTGNATSLTISNWPASGTEGWMKFTINHGAGPYTWVDPANTVWASGAAPTLSDGASEISVVMYATADAGTTVYGYFGGEDFS